jgi:putative ABC transporter-associated repeat protein
MKLLLALLLPVAIVPAPPTEQVVIAEGHVDLGPRFVDGKWTIQLRDDTGDPVVWRPLENVVVQANDAAVVPVPSDPSYAFLGTPGAKVWVIPQVQQAGVVWPGWNTQDPEVATRVDREVTWKLNGVDGPGAFTLFLSSDFGKPAPVFDSRKPYPQETGVDVNTHVHGNWTFATPGTYLLDITMTAKLTDGTTVTDTRPLRLHAGPGNSREAFKTTAVVDSKADRQIPWLWMAGAVVLLLVATFVPIRRRRA